MSSRIEGIKQQIKAMADREGKYLIFTLANEEYGVSTMKIREIIGMMPITFVPQTPDFAKGVINLRGKVIPVVDLRLRFGMARVERTVKILLDIDRVLSAEEIAVSDTS